MLKKFIEGIVVGFCIVTITGGFVSVVLIAIAFLCDADPVLP